MTKISTPVIRSLPRSRVIEQPPRRGDEDVRAALQLAVLLVEGDAADQQCDVELVVLAVFLEVLGDLGGEFARRLEDQGARHARARTPLLQQGQHRQHEARRLARPGLGDAQDVAALERRRNGADLNRGGFGVAGVFDCQQDFLA